MDFAQAYRKILTGAKEILENRGVIGRSGLDPDYRPRVYLRNSPFRHFRGGDYDSGGKCTATALQVDSVTSDYFGSYAELIHHAIDLEMLERYGVESLEVTAIALEREDAHRTEKDCTHQCFPGVPDA